MASLVTRQQRLGWLFLVPTIAVLLTVGAYPLLQTFVASFSNAQLASSKAVRFVGLENYDRLLHDVKFREAFGHTITFTGVSVFLEFAFGLGIALALNTKFRGRGIVRAAILVPWALPTVVSAKIWNYMFVDTYGVVNDLLVTQLHLLPTKIAWLARPGFALGSIIAVDVWKTTPFVALVLLAGLQTIPPTLYEAAQVDGASPRQRLFAITLPLLSPVIMVALVFRTLDALRVFDVIWVMTGGAFATESMATFNYRVMIESRKLGYGSAVSVVLFVIISIFVVLFMAFLRPREKK